MSELPERPWQRLKLLRLLQLQQHLHRLLLQQRLGQSHLRLLIQMRRRTTMMTTGERRRLLHQLRRHSSPNQWRTRRESWPLLPRHHHHLLHLPLSRAIRLAFLEFSPSASS